MSYGIINQQLLTNIANAIRTKLGVATTYTPAEMPDAIASISGGGITPTGTKNINANGTYDVTNYASAEVAVPTEASTLGTKSITANGTYNASDDSLDGYSAVTVNVSGGSSGIYSWLPASAELVASVDETINLSADTSWDSITPSTSSQTILAAGDARAACNYTLTAEETANKAIIAVVNAKTEYTYTSTPSVSYPLSQELMSIAQYCMLDLEDVEDYGLRVIGTTFVQSYKDKSGNTAITISPYYGIGSQSHLFSTSSTSSTTPTVGFTRNAIVTRCNDVFFSTDSAALIDSANTNIVCKYRIYMVDKADSTLYACFDATNGIIS